jgi:hypothetical protein
LIRQEIKYLQNGTYDFSMWNAGGCGEQQEVMYVELSGFGGENQKVYFTSPKNFGEYSNAKIDGVQIQNNKIDVTIYVKTKVSTKVYIDDVALTIVPGTEVGEKPAAPPDAGKTDESQKAYTGFAVKGTPVIDGMIDYAWNSVPEIVPEVLRSGTEMTSTRYKIMWDENNTYILAQINETAHLDSSSPDVWNQDAIEIYLDEDNSKNAAKDKQDRKFIVSHAGGIRNFDTAGTKGIEYVAKEVNGGDVVEKKVPFFNPHKAGDEIGFDTQIDSTKGTTKRAAITGWSGKVQGGDNPVEWGTVTLINPIVLQSKGITLEKSKIGLSVEVVIPAEQDMHPGEETLVFN